MASDGFPEQLMKTFNHPIDTPFLEFQVGSPHIAVAFHFIAQRFQCTQGCFAFAEEDLVGV